MTLSAKTQTLIATTNILESQDLYPAATVFSSHNTASNPWEGQTVMRLDPLAVPSTTRDMSVAYKWQHGDKVRGTHAKESEALKRFREDINKAYGREGDYKAFYIDTLTSKKSVGEQLKNK